MQHLQDSTRHCGTKRVQFSQREEVTAQQAKDQLRAILTWMSQPSLSGFCCALTVERNAGVYFGQLLGMADHLSFTLGRAGYRIHKIVPYGPVHETLQYLTRYAS